jgi:hypothetical protein
VKHRNRLIDFKIFFPNNSSLSPIPHVRKKVNLGIVNKFIPVYWGHSDVVVWFLPLRKLEIWEEIRIPDNPPKPGGYLSRNQNLINHLGANDT